MPIYLNFFLLKNNISDNFWTKSLFTFLLLLGFFLFFYKKHSFFQTGFFIGIFWFYWIGLSFRYYNFTWMIPIIILLIGIAYGTIFWGLNKFFNLFKFSFLNLPIATYLWILFLTFGFDYISPFTFDWLKPEVLFVNSFFGVDKINMLLVFSAIILYQIDKKFLLLLIIPLFINNSKPTSKPKLKIFLASTNIPQNLKWKKSYIPYEIENNFNIINKAIKKNYNVVVLPESVFPMFLNLYPNLMQKLITLSKKITIITGGLHYKNKKYFNATYIFENRKVTILDKHLLVPFGEYIPLPFFEKEINHLFFGDGSDYQTSKHFGTFHIKNYKFINAICYETTAKSLYKLKPHYIIGISNLAWFKPSVIPSIQEMLIKVYSKKYKKIVYHSINGFRSYIIDNGKLIENSK